MLRDELKQLWNRAASPRGSSPTTFPLHTNLLEGINNKIKVFKRMAYFFLKIRAAFTGSLPGNAG